MLGSREPAVEFFVGVLHRREPQRAMLLVQSCHGGLPTKMVPSDLTCSLAPDLRLASSVAAQERCQSTSLYSPLLLLKAASLD